jgi:uncharacterized protein (UPF0128 family)
MAAQVIKEQSLVYGLWLNQSEGKRAYFVINVDKAKHSEFKKLMEENSEFDCRLF